MAYDADLAERIRELLAGDGAVEKKMFGGLAFLVGGNMAVAASGQGGLLVRVDPAESDALVAPPPAGPAGARRSGRGARPRRLDAGRADGHGRPLDERVAPRADTRGACARR